MAALPNPTVLSSTTRFRPTHVRAHSRSPSRSPVRKAQFTAQYLDPLLRNLSPDSTLKALQATQIIPQGPEQDVLTKSITDATPAEREMGIRAAFAAQKLREWHNEILQWDWPSRRDRAVGAGFLSPQESEEAKDQNGNRRIYLGSLPVYLVDQYEQRIDEIRDALETLEMEDIKDHVLQAHNSKLPPAASAEAAEKRSATRRSYGRMRDFTALITATVIQALPDLATVSMLLDTWNVRLTVLRDLPVLLDLLHASRAGVRAACATVRDTAQAPLITLPDFETTKQMLGDKVTDLGSRIDKMLDLLEGQEDALPQIWIDSLETIELDYATWVAETQRIANQNQSRDEVKDQDLEASARSPIQPHNEDTTSSLPAPPVPEAPAQTLHSPPEPVPAIRDADETRNTTNTQKPALSLILPGHSGHRRQKSEVSIADSAYSAFSDVEIVDATQTQVLPSPKVNLVDSPFRAEKPPMLQRASTASIEVIHRDQLKRVDLRRSISADLLAKMSQTPDSTPSKALEQLSGQPRTGTTPLAELEDPTSTIIEIQETSSPTESLALSTVAPLRTPSRADNEENSSTPTLPRRSSKRKSVELNALISSNEGPPSQSEIVSPIESQDLSRPDSGENNAIAHKRRQTDAEGESLEAKIQDILLKLPSQIRLAKNGQGSHSTEDSSTASTRASTPTPALTLSPVKPSRRSSPSDTDVRVFHLTQHGQSRDTAPIKLFVRTIGENGERVMVRVGGGWADLGEYLKEYSLHHGRRSVSEGQLEVAQYPGKQRKDGSVPSGPPRKVRHVRGRSRSPSPPGKGTEEKVWTPPPVPPIPASYTVQSPVFTTISKPNGSVVTNIEDPHAPMASVRDSYFPSTEPAGTVRSNTVTTAGVTTTTTVSVPPNPKGGKYTPLGAAGPKAGPRRSVTFGTTPAANDSEAWVAGMVGKARAVSSNVVQGPTTSTTTKITASAPSSRRGSATVVPPASQKSSTTAASSKDSPQVGKRKSLLGLGDVGGIKRVFLRRKSDKGV